MRFIGKIQLKKEYPMIVVAEELGLKEVTIFGTQDIVGTMQWRGGPILILLHLSWGTMTKVLKARIYAHHIEGTENDEFLKLVMERFGEMIEPEKNKR
jgi:hypothetical protein